MTGRAVRAVVVDRMAAAMLTVVLGLGLAQASSAAIVSRNVDVTLNALNIESYDLDVNLDGITDFTFTAALLPDPEFSVGFGTVDFRFGSPNAVVIDAPTGDGFPTASLLPADATVSAADVFSGPNDQGNLFFFTPFDPPSGRFLGRSGYVGFRFADSAGGTDYGYLQVTVNALDAVDNPLGLTLGTVAYNDETGQAFQVRQVPEPDSLALSMLGALVLLLSSRKPRGRRWRFLG